MRVTSPPARSHLHPLVVHPVKIVGRTNHLAALAVGQLFPGAEGVVPPDVVGRVPDPVPAREHLWRGRFGKG